MKIGVCCIIKNENLYLRDWVTYYKEIGIDNIILYDNNDENGEYPHQVIGDYIANGFVICKDVRGKHRWQLNAYDECYTVYKEEYDWIGFLDCDEFLAFKNTNLHKFFEQDIIKNHTDMIPLYWLIYGDNNLVHYDKRPVYERFTIPNLPTDANNFKYFIKGIGSNIFNVKFNDANDFSYNFYNGSEGVCRMASGRDVTQEQGQRLYRMAEYDTAYIKHYNTYTIEEFLYRRFGRRGYADTMSSFNKDVIMNVFTSINEMTEEKEKIINDFFDKFKFEDDNV